MSFSLEIESNADTIVQVFQQLPREFRKSRRSGLSSTGFFLIKETADWINSEGEKTWPKASQVAKQYMHTRPNWRMRRRFYRGPYSFLAGAARYKISRSSSQVIIGYGTAGSGSAKFDRNTMRIARLAQKNRSILVTPRMRRHFGAQRNVRPIGRRTKDKENIIGKDIFPLRAETTQIKIPARPISKPVFLRAKAKVFPLFSRKFGRSLKKRFERAPN